MSTLQRIRPLYVNPSANVTVWQGLLNSQPVAIKDSIYVSITHANASIKEALVMATVRHPAICRVYECFLEQCEEGYRVVLAVELMANDLAMESHRRKVRRNYWTEEELMDILRTVVGGLCAAKLKGIAHRDIKPHNLFLSGNTVKIGDFGSAAFDPLANYQRTTLQGTPYYLSPELKVKYAKYLSQEPYNTEYDPFISDIYSLGITMVYLALLDGPEELGVLVNLRENTATVIRKLEKYRVLQRYLIEMLEIDPTCRVNIEELQGKLNSSPVVPYIRQESCCGCQTVCQFDSVQLACGHYFHSSDCLFRFIRGQTACFTLGNSPKCPLCSFSISQEHLSSIYGAGKYESLVESEYLSKCCVCHQREVQVSYKKCKHLCCSQCQVTLFAMNLCPICSRFAKFIRLGANSSADS